jgi:ubiquinone/menaquinone biosynthesis C-methylase UbiE
MSSDEPARGGGSRSTARTDDAAAYWSRVARSKPFAHELDFARLGALLPRTARVLDLGCGWGRSMHAMRAAGWTDVVGADFAEGMLIRGAEESPDLRLVRADGRRLPFRDASFDGAVVLAVLTAVPRDDDQRAIASELRRVLRPGGVVAISDLLLNDDERNAARYRDFAARREPGLPWGVFALPEGVTLRHHSRDWLREVFGAFREESFEPFTATTMNGHTSNAFRLFLRR